MGERRTEQTTIINRLYLEDDAIVTVIPVPKFTNIYGKRGISVNLPQICEVGLPGTKARMGFNTFKEPVAQQLRA